MSEINNEHYHNYLTFLLSGQRNQCHQIVQNLLDDGIDIKDLYINLFQASMYQIGKLWETNQISVAKEHLATSITESLLHLVYPRIFSQDRCQRSAVISCCANEYHQIGGKMVADIFEMHGWDGHFLGSNTPIDDLLSLIQEKNPEYVGLSLALGSNLPKLESSIQGILEVAPQIKILLGGQAFREQIDESIIQYSNIRCIASLYELEDLIQQQS